MTTSLVSGASGQLGRKVLDELIAAGVGPIVATTRNPDSLREYAARGVEIRIADFDDETTLAAAFRGVDRALIISTDALDRPGKRLRQHLTAVHALKTAGVRHIVYTSLINPGPESVVSIAPDHRQTEAAIVATGLDYTILRNNLYSDLLLMSLPAALAGGQLVDARGNGSTGFVTRDDCARAAAAALSSQASGQRIFDITGAELLTSAEVAAIASEISGKPLQHQSVSPEALLQGMQAHGLPDAVAQMLVSFDVAIAQGQLAVTTDAVAQLTGRPPQSLRAYLQAQAAALKI